MLSIDAEIKVTVAQAEVEPALAKLGLTTGDGEAMRVCFAEDSPSGTTPEAHLLNGDVIVRARERGGDRDDDCTVKIRPCRRSQLSSKYLALTAAEDAEFKLEADWAGDHRVLAASFTVELPGHPVARARTGGTSLGSVFTDRQQAFLDDCADITVNLDALTLLSRPVTAVRWKPERFDGAMTSGKIRAERWTVDELDYLEFSITAPVTDAVEEQAKLVNFLKGKGIELPGDQLTKTQQVLGRLLGMTGTP